MLDSSPLLWGENCRRCRWHWQWFCRRFRYYMCNKPEGPKYLEFSKETEVTNQATLSLQISVLRIRISLMRIRVLSFTRIRFLPLSFPWLDPPMLQNDPLRIPPFHFDPDPAFHFYADLGPASNLMRIWIQLPKWCGSGSDPQRCFKCKEKYAHYWEILLIFLSLGPPTRGWLIK